jgi:SprB repeat
MKNALPCFFCIFLFAFSVFFSTDSFAQCGTLTATTTIVESRCTATGTIQVLATGGQAPGLYQYKLASGPVTTGFTSSNLFAGLPPGNYSVIIKDVTGNCSITLANNIVTGNYSAPTVLYGSSAITCMNGNNGTIFVTNQSGGRAPFSYTIIAPSPANIGMVSATGTFSGLVAGLYTIRLSDSCGGIQTRNQRVNGYKTYLP